MKFLIIRHQIHADNLAECSMSDMSLLATLLEAIVVLARLLRDSHLRGIQVISAPNMWADVVAAAADEERRI